VESPAAYAESIGFLHALTDAGFGTSERFRGSISSDMPFGGGCKGGFMKPSLPQEAYDAIADAYAALVDTKPHNACYERPATMSLIGDVQGKSILDMGCGTGSYAKWLVERGARVTAVDANEKMLAHARRRLAGDATFYLANMEEPLDYLQDESFDGILSALAVTYVQHHAALFAEFRRVLRPGGWFVFSTEHPFFSYAYFKVEDYFETREVSCEWEGFGEKVLMKSYYHSLGEICGALSDEGFVIERILEPKPVKEFEKASPEDYRKLMKFPLFICFRARKTV
jgi:ubiquinone/menaquinone biosynthesis C-methylase UbiE